MFSLGSEHLILTNHTDNALPLVDAHELDPTRVIFKRDGEALRICWVIRQQGAYAVLNPRYTATVFELPIPVANQRIVPANPDGEPLRHDVSVKPRGLTMPARRD